MKTLLYILDYYLPHKWGVETVFEQIINRSLSSWYKVIVLTSHYDSSLKKSEKSWNISIIRSWKSRKAFIWNWFLEWIKILKNNKDIIGIHTSTYWWAIPASLLWIIFHKKVLITVHEIFWKLWNLYKSWKTAWIYRLFEWIIFSLPYDKYHCVSCYTLNSLRTNYWIKDEKLFLAYNGVDYQFWNKNQVSDEESDNIKKKFWLGKYWTLLYFWHTWISKGIDLLVESIPQILKENKDTQIIFNFIPANRDSYIKGKIARIIENFSPKDKWRIKIWNGLPKNELRSLVANVNWVIAPSLSEGFWSVHTETLALWTPLITTCVASLPEVVGGDVIFFKSWNKDSLCEAVRKLKNKDYQKMPEKYFSWDEQYQEILKWYREIE